MANWPSKPRLIGTSITRIDGMAKASGRAKYPSDFHPEGMLFGVILYSPHAHAKITSIDTAAAEKLPGVKAIELMAQAGGILFHQGDSIAAVAAETEEQARDGAEAIKVVYEVLPHVVTERQATAPGAPDVLAKGNARAGRAQVRGKPEEELDKAEKSIDATYSAPVITHVCLETHGLTAHWKADDSIEAWASTQNVYGVANELAQGAAIDAAKVLVHTPVMGGGFGSKFGADAWGQIAAKLSKKAGNKPVRLFLDRIQEHLTAGNRPSAAGHIRMGASKDGKITAIIAETHGTGGRGNAGFPFPYVYSVPNVSRAHTDVLVNCGGARAMRAPGHPQGCILMESAMDDMAEELGMDPLEFRLKNLGDRDMIQGVNRTDIYRGEIELGAKAIGWKEHRKPRGRNGDGPIKRGFGMALHQWGGGGQNDKKVGCIINADGSVEVRSATQDLGTGVRTVLAIIAAEILGLEVADITSNIGESNLPVGQPSGGSTTTPSMASPCFDAVSKARDELFKKIAPGLDCKVEDLSLEGGKLLVKGEAKMSWKDACRKLGTTKIDVIGNFQPGMSSAGVGGAQFAEVTVDVETGVVRLKKIVAVQDSGLILDLLTWKSQVYGGIIGGLNYGLFEERIMDEATGLMLNPDMEMYKLAGASDIPEIEVIPYDTPEMLCPRRHRHRRTADDRHRRRHRQRRLQRHRRSRAELADVTHERPQRLDQRREGLTHESL